MALNVLALAGGVGGAKLADGLAQALPDENLTVVVNTGDDFEHLGLHISPDLDTVVYTLAGLASRRRGWGRAQETWHALETLRDLGGADWFRLGDKDIGLHLFRTERLRNGATLSEVTAAVCRALGVGPTVLPMSDQRIATMVGTSDGELPFQTYFVAHRCEPAVKAFRFRGAREARPAPGVMHAVRRADLVVICPSNPLVSIDPILAVPDLRQALEPKEVVAVSPIVGGKALKGPAAKMYRELGQEPSASTVARHYGPLLDGFVLDEADRAEGATIGELGIVPHACATIMHDRAARKGLAREVLKFAQSLRVGVPG